ncbi:AMP-binding protein [Streptomyces eurythermus]
MPSSAPRPHGRVDSRTGTGTGHPRDALLPDLFTARALRSPDSDALVWSGGRWTFRELHDRVRCAAARLRARGVAPGDIVAVLLEPSPQWVVSALAVLEADAVYLPLDPRTPPERLATMIEDSSPACLVTVPGATAHRYLPPPRHVTTRDLEGEAPPEPSRSRPTRRRTTDAAYLIHTSGSTGTPKGVLCSHRGMVRFVTADHPAVPRPGDRLLATAHPTFDVSCYEIFCTLLNGACLILPEPEDLLDTETLARSLRHHRVITLWLSAGLFHVHAQSAPHIFSGLRCLMVGGDSVVPGAVRAVLAQGPPGTLVNGYVAPYLPLFTEPLPDTGVSVAQAYFSGLRPAGRTRTVRPQAGVGPARPPVDERLLDLYPGRLRESGYLPPPDPAPRPSHPTAL